MRVPAWLLMLVAGILFGPNASLIILVGGGEWPLLYGAVGSFGMGCMFGLGAVGLSTTAMAWSMVPVAGVWLLVALWLGRRQKVLAGGA